MLVLDTHVDSNDPLFTSNRDRMQQLVSELASHTGRAREGGGAKYMGRHRAQHKLPVRERIARLLDSASPFLDLGRYLATLGKGVAGPGDQGRRNCST